MKPSAQVFFTAFAAAFPVLYAIAVAKNYALFTYHPTLNEFGVGVQAPIEGPAMYWYGWMASAGLAALIVSLAASLVPQRVGARLWPGCSWAVPLAVLLWFVWLLKGYFLR